MACPIHKNNLNKLAIFLGVFFVFAFIITEAQAGINIDIYRETTPQEKAKAKKAKDKNEKPLTLEEKVKQDSVQENLTELQKQARMYREQGLNFQEMGNLEAALSLYQKAIELDPTYAVAYNDLGVIYETFESPDRAEQSYLQAVKIDPTYLSAYTNLAIFYENNRNLGKAAYYWQRRAELGSPDDPWTKKARQRLNDIGIVMSEKPLTDAKEKEIVALLRETAIRKSLLKKDDKAQARDNFNKAKLCYKNGDDVTALKLAIDAQQLDPDNKDIEAFIDKVQNRLLSR